MSTASQIVVCAGIMPDPLQTLEPVASPTGPALKNEMMLPAVLDPWAGHALYGEQSGQMPQDLQRINARGIIPP